METSGLMMLHYTPRPQQQPHQYNEICPSVLRIHTLTPTPTTDYKHSLANDFHRTREENFIQKVCLGL